MEWSTFSGRFRAQKGIYLLKHLGYPVGNYSFSLYLNGPYCPELANEYYNFRTGASFSPSLDFKIDPKHLRLIREAFSKEDEFLETIVTLHWIQMTNKGISALGIIKHFISIKPRLESYVEEGWAFLRRHNMVQGST